MKAGDKSMENLFADLLAKAWMFCEQGRYQPSLDMLNSIASRLQRPLTRQEQSVLCERMGNCLHALGKDREAADIFQQAAVLAAVRERQQEDYSNSLFLRHYQADLSDEELSRLHFGYEDLVRGLPKLTQPHPPHKRLRIGYLSPDFREHIVAYFVMQIFACYDRRQYEVFCYDVRGWTDGVTKQMQGLVDGWRNLSELSPADAAGQISADEIDILVDLGGHSGGGHTLRIAAYRPAPIQVAGLGYMSTTGMQAMDYFLTDSYCDPPGLDDALFSEKLLRLPHSHFCYTPPERAKSCKRHWQPGESIVFGSFNNFSKLSDEMLGIWLKILQQVPGSRLLLKNPYFNHAQQERDVLRRARAVGYQPNQIEVRSATKDYLEEYQGIDIALDPYPYPGGGTTCEALFMGIPVITLAGKRHGTRFGYSLLMNIGLGELTADTVPEYIANAAALAQNRDLLMALHQQIPVLLKASPVMDGRAYTKELEEKFQEIWQDFYTAYTK